MPTWNAIANSPTRYVRVGSDGAIEANTDPTAFDNVWVAQASGVANDLHGVAWNGFRFVTVGEGGVGLTSPDGLAPWTAVTTGVATDLYGIAAGGNVFIACGAGGVLRSSQNGFEWGALTSGTTYDLWGVTVASGEYTAVGDNDVIVTGTITSTLLDIILAPVIGMSDVIDSSGIFNVEVQESIAFEELTHGDAASTFFIYLNDELAISSVQTTDTWVGNASAVDSVGINGQLLISSIANLLLQDSVGINDQLLLNTFKSVLVEDSFVLNDALTAYYHRLLTETLGMSAVVSAAMVNNVVLEEALLLSDAADANGAFQITILDDLTLSDTLSLNQILHAIVTEGLSFSVSVTIDGEVYYAWVVNTETFGTTQYANYGFQSFCEIDGEYFATDGTSIYRLGGDDDAGTKIDAEVSLGATDFGSAYQKGIQDVFLGLSADGKMVVKVVTDEKTEDWYELDPSETSLHGTKVKTGRGLKARYYRIKLRNKQGADFELDSIRMVPVSTGRRVK